MASRILANLLVAGGSVLVRAAAQAWKQAIANGQRSGMTPESLKNAANLSKQMPLEEAYKILGTDSQAGIEEVMKRYQHLMEANQKNGSFYLQSKIYRARERIEQEARGDDTDTAPPGS
jgi:import inner membrane translocase subunit TIM16